MRQASVALGTFSGGRGVEELSRCDEEEVMKQALYGFIEIDPILRDIGEPQLAPHIRKMS